MYILLISILILLPMKFLFENSPQEVFEPPSSFWGSRCHPLRLETLKFWKDWCCNHDDPYKENLPAMTMKENNFPPVLEGVVPVWFSRSSKTASFASSSFSAASSMLVSVSCKEGMLNKKSDACNHNHCEVVIINIVIRSAWSWSQWWSKNLQWLFLCVCASDSRCRHDLQAVDAHLL